MGLGDVVGGLLGGCVVVSFFTLLTSYAVLCVVICSFYVVLSFAFYVDVLLGLQTCSNITKQTL